MHAAALQDLRFVRQSPPLRRSRVRSAVRLPSAVAVAQLCAALSAPGQRSTHRERFSTFGDAGEKSTFPRQGKSVDSPAKWQWVSVKERQRLAKRRVQVLWRGPSQVAGRAAGSRITRCRIEGFRMLLGVRVGTATTDKMGVLSVWKQDGNWYGNFKFLGHFHFRGASGSRM